MAGWNSAAYLLLIVCSVTVSSKPQWIDGELPPNMKTIETEAPIDTVTDPVLDDYSSYKKGISSPMSATDLELRLDTNDEVTLDEYNFEPEYLLDQLIINARSNNVTSKYFLKDIQDMITLHDRLTKNAGKSDLIATATTTTTTTSTPRYRDSYYDDDSYYYRRSSRKVSTTTPATTTPTTATPTVVPTPNTTEILENDLKSLEGKYNICSECYGSGDISIPRLILMFPHYLNIGQRPFVTPTNIDLSTSGRTSNYGYNNYGYSLSLPSFFKRPEFGGLIPRTGLSSQDRKMIIGLHLFALYPNTENNPVPFRTTCVLLKWRMERSLLSDDRKLRFLQNNGVIQSSKTLKSSISTKYNSISSEYLNEIDWSLFE